MQATDQQKPESKYANLMRVCIEEKEAFKPDMIERVCDLIVSQIELMEYDTKYLRLLLVHYYGIEQEALATYSTKQLVQLALESTSNKEVKEALCQIGRMMDEWSRIASQFD